MHQQAQLPSTSAGRPHYLALDGLRGVAALVVVWYHIFEAFAESPLSQEVNHGYLAVDFFFLLSGFVVSYAYDGRWGQMGLSEFIKRRLICLHPMLILSALLGGLMFYTQATPTQPLHLVPIGMVLLSTLMNALLIPSLPSWEIRGYTEIFPLNGPTWSLFFEYIGNILYALVLRHLPTWGLTLAVLLCGAGLAYEGFVHSPWGYLGAGWSFADGGFWGGLARVCFSFGAGVLLSRLYRPVAYRRGFWLSALVLVALLVMPRIGDADTLWMNALYECVVVMLIFPVLLWLGASDSTDSPRLRRLYTFLGELSYPLYIIHYPSIYLYIAWVRSNELTVLQSLPWALALFFGNIVLAYLLLRIYDLPVRRWLSRRLVASDQ